ncbi:MAG: dihydrofolate reductase [Pseudomonadota bacterium]
MRISLVVAVARNGVIGRKGALAWKISDDLKRFRELTTGHPVIMGRKTYDSIGKPLANRINIVISRSMAPERGVVIAQSIEEALRLGAEAAAHLDVEEMFVIGGADIYAKTLPLAHRIYLTAVAADVEGDVRMPAFDPAGWTRRLAGRSEKSPRNEHDCEYFILDRR